MDQLSSRGIMPVVGSIVFLFAAPGLLGVFIPWYTTGWHMDEPLLGFEPLRWLRRRADPLRRRGPARFLRPLSVAGPRHAGTDLSYRDAGGFGRLPLRAQSDVPRGHRADRRPGAADR